MKSVILKEFGKVKIIVKQHTNKESKMEENINNNHIQRFKQFDKVLIDDSFFNTIPKKLLNSRKEVYYCDKDQKLLKNDVVLRKIDQSWEISAKIDDEYGYHRVNCESYREADQILSTLIHLRLHQTEPLFEIQCTNLMGKLNDGTLVKLVVCKITSPKDFKTNDLIFASNLNNQNPDLISKYQFFQRLLSNHIKQLNQQPKLIKAPSMNLLKRYASKELITYEDESLKRLIKLKSIHQMSHSDQHRIS